MMAAAKILNLYFLSLVSIATVHSHQDSCFVHDSTPVVWLGGEQQGYDCQDDLPSCSHFGLDFICEDPDGGEFPPCVNGTKFLCASPPPSPLVDPAPVSTLRVLAYNILELPYPYWQVGQRERTCRIPHEVFRLHPDIDVIVFNEVFQGGCFSKFYGAGNASVLSLRDILIQRGFGHFTETVGEPVQPPYIANGGVFIASRWPILLEKSHIFSASDNSTIEALTAQGAVYVKINKTVGESMMVYHILGTHLQSSETPTARAARLKQADEMRRLMEMQNIPSNEAVIYAGDFNVINGTGHATELINILNATLPPNIGKYIYTFDGPENDLLIPTIERNLTQWLDYTIYSSLHLQPSNATMEAIRPQFPVATDICLEANESVPIYPNSSRCLKVIQARDLSDHYAVLGVFEFNHSTTSATGASFYPLSSLFFELLMMLVYFLIHY